MKSTIYLLFILSFPQVYGAESNPISGLGLSTQKPVSVSPSQSQKGLVVVFLSPRCPCSRSHEEHLRQLYEEYSKKGFQFVGVHSNSNETFTEAKSHFETRKLPFEVISDPKSIIANQLGALSTPHAFIISPGGETIYLGGVSDSSQFSRSKKHYLKEALQALSVGESPPIHKTRALGCVIRRP